jgi:hypothetical protein
MVDRSDLIAASVYSRKLFRDCSSNSLLRERRGSKVSRLQNESGYPHHSLGLSCVGMRPLLPKMGHGSARPPTKASGPPAVGAPGTTAVDVPGLPSASVAGLSSSTSATTAVLSSWSRTGRSGMTTGGGASANPTSAAMGGSAGESATAPARVDAGAGNKSGGLGAAAASAASPGMMAAPTGGSAWEACPMATRAAWAPPEGALCGSQPTGVARHSTGCRSRVRLRLLKEREGKFKTYSETKTKAEVSSYTYPLWGKANRACGEAPRALVSADAAEGCPAAGFGAASTSGARGAEGAARPGVVTTAEGPASCAACAGACPWGACGSA